LHVVLVDAGRVLAAEEAEGDRTPGLDRELAEAAVIVTARVLVPERAIGVLPRDLEDAGVELAHHVDEPAHPPPVGDAAGDGAAGKPIAPACRPSRSSASIARRSSSLACCSNARSPITYVLSAEWPRYPE